MGCGAAVLASEVGYWANLADSSPSVVPAIPQGSIAPLQSAGVLAVAPSGTLYVLSTESAHSEANQRILVRLPNGEFRDVVGDGATGVSGDAGPATKAALSDVTDMAFGPDGDLYIADGGRIRVVDHQGIIRTIADNGAQSIAFGPTGALYATTQTELLRMDGVGGFTRLKAVVPNNGTLRSGTLGGFGSLAVADDSTVYVSGGFGSWSVYKVLPSGMASYVTYARAAGGFYSEIRRSPTGAIMADSNWQLVQLAGSGGPSFPARNGSGLDEPFTLHNYAFGPHNIIYADDVGYSGFSSVQQLVEQDGSTITSLWSHKIDPG